MCSRNLGAEIYDEALRSSNWVLIFDSLPYNFEALKVFKVYFKWLKAVFYYSKFWGYEGMFQEARRLNMMLKYILNHDAMINFGVILQRKLKKINLYANINNIV